MKNKYKIQVRKDNKIIEVIGRVLYAENIGNFTPIFCRYKNDKRCLVKSEMGDISDPFRREESYLNTLFIEIINKGGDENG